MAAVFAGISTLVLGSCTEWPTERSVPGSFIAFDTDVAGEVRGGSISEHWVEAEKAGKYQVRFEATGGRPGSKLHLEVVGGLTSYRLTEVTSTVGDLAGPAESPWLLFPASVPYVVRVRGEDATAEGAYRFRLLAGERRLQYGDTVAGMLLPRAEQTLDADVFTFDGVAGEQVIVFLQPTAGRGISVVQLRLNGPDGEITRIQTTPPRPALESVSSSRIRLLRDGRYTITVEGIAHDPVPYRLHLARVNTQPSSGGSVLQAGEERMERIETVGDVDEFRLQARAGASYIAVLRVDTGLAGGIRLEVLQGSTAVADAEVSAAAPLRSTRSFPAAGGELLVRVAGRAQGASETDTGRYGVTVYEIDPRPEFAARRLQPGDEVAGEAIDHPGDLDEFVFAAPVGTSMMVRLDAEVINGRFPGVRVIAPNGAVRGRPLARHNSGAFIVDQPGDHRIVVVEDAERPLHVGRYSLHLEPIEARPERVPERIPSGEWIRGESIDPASDVDRFVFTAPAGQEVIAFPRLLPGFVGNLYLEWSEWTLPKVRSFDHACSERYSCHTEVMRLGSSGEHTLTVSGASSHGDWDPSYGPYELKLLLVNPEPEHVAAQVQIGDTIRGESIDYIGDRDVFRFYAEADDRLMVRVISADLPLSIHVVPEGLIGQDHTVAVGGSYWYNVPRSGVYLLSVRRIPTAQGPATGSYTVSLERRP